MPVYDDTMFAKIDSDTKVKILASGHYAGVYLPGAMSERVKQGHYYTKHILFTFSYTEFLSLIHQNITYPKCMIDTLTYWQYKL